MIIAYSVTAVTDSLTQSPTAEGGQYGRSRLRRNDDLPWSVRYELEQKAQYRRRIDFDAAGQALRFCYRASRRRSLGDDGDGVVQQRSAFGWIMDGDDRLGALNFVEWFIDPFANPDTFLQEMDDESSEAIALGEILVSAWDLEELASYGGVLEFRLAWMTKSAAAHSIWAAVAEQFIVSRRDQFGVLLLKAFPLEYEGAAPEGSVAAAALAFRRRAMMRHYRRVLNVTSLPGVAGTEGWMWRPLSSDVPLPSPQV